MSSHLGRIPPLQVRETAGCLCADGLDCSSIARGDAWFNVSR